jgi:putative transposase
MEQTLEECRWVYNQTLAFRRDAWKERSESKTYYDTCKLLPEWKQNRPSLSIVYSQVLQDVQRRVDRAFLGFFYRIKNGERPGYPRFKGKGRYRSFTYPQFGFGLTEDGKLHLAKIGDIKIVLHRPLQGKVKRVTIRCYPTGKWFACFSCEVEPEPLPLNEKATGVDVGISKFLTLSDDTRIPNPDFFRKEEKALAKAQRRLSKCEKGTPEYKRALRVVQRIHERIRNKRDDFIHKLSLWLIRSFGIICFEKLNIKGMLKNHCLAKAISDCAWAQLVRYTLYKAESAGRVCVLVDPRYTTKMCSRCGCIIEISLSERTFNCPHCGLALDRDVNAAINILRLGLQSLGKSPRSLPL